MKVIHCADAVEWLRGQRDVGSVVTSLPDAEEIGRPLAEWAPWFHQSVRLCVAAASPGCPVVLYQTDRKGEGQTHSKALLCMSAAASAGARLLWHKIVLRRDVGKVDIHRPGFTHLMAFSVKARPGTASPDVIERGRMIYPNAMGMDAALFAVRFAAGYDRRLVDPFCGRGTIPAVAEALGLEAVGVDIDPAQCEHARALRLRAVPA